MGRETGKALKPVPPSKNLRLVAVAVEGTDAALNGVWVVAKPDRGFFY